MDNFGDDAVAPTKLMEAPEFKNNPIGVDFDPDELWKQLQADGEQATLRKHQDTSNFGTRGMDTVPAAYME